MEKEMEKRGSGKDRRTEKTGCTGAEFLDVINKSKSFPPCYSQSPVLNDFLLPSPPPPLS
jgi:hypothetical protein